MIKPLGNKIMLEITELKFGAVQSESIAEQGKIIAIGNRVNTIREENPLLSVDVTGNINPIFNNYTIFEVGKTLYFKAWAVDIITDTDGKKYYFISSDSDAICGISNE